MKVIKFLNQDGKDYIRTFDDSEIETEYNVYDFYYLNEDYEDNIKEYKEERAQEVADYIEENEDYTLQDIKQVIEDLQERFEYDCSKGTSQYGRPKRFVQFTDCEDSYVTDTEGFFYDSEGKEPVNNDSHEQKFVQEWDGNNWKKIYLECEFETFNEDITEELEETFLNMTEIGSNKEQNSKSWNDYYYYNGVLIEEGISLYANDQNSYTIIEDKEEIDGIFVAHCKDKIDEHRPEMRKEYGNNLEVIEDRTFDGYDNHISYQVFSMDDCEELDTWVNDPYSRTNGGTYYAHEEHGIIQYTWSAYQGSWCGYSLSEKSKEEILQAA